MVKPSLTWLDDPEVFRVNQLPAHSDHAYFRNQDELTKASGYVHSLDGEWQFIYADNPMARPVGFEQPAYPTARFETIRVPQHIELANYKQIQYVNTQYPWDGHQYRRPAYTLKQTQLAAGTFSQAPDNAVGAYRRAFDLPKDWQGLTVHLRFEGVERAFYVWLNGHFVGYAEDSFTPAEFDLTPYLEPHNLLAVAVFEHSTASYLEDQDFFRFFGIFRSVSLCAIPKTHVADLSLKPRVVGGVGHLALTLKLSPVTPTATVRVTVQDAAGESCYQTQVEATATCVFEDITIEDVQLWDHHHPYLYHVLIEIEDEGACQEVVPHAFGFRTLAIDQGVLQLNGERLILTGVNRHEWDAHHGRVINRATMHQDIETMLANHINAVRTSHYPNQLAWYKLCDEAGIYVMAEVNLEAHGTWQKLGAIEPSYNVPGDLPQWEAAVVDRARTTYETLKNHPAILFWSLGNESYAGSGLVAMNQFFKDHDDSRLTHYEGVVHRRELAAQITDVESRMYAPPEEVAAYLTAAPKKPLVLCEYMHSMGNSVGGMGAYMALIERFPQFAGGFIWDFIDQALAVVDPITQKPVLRYGGDFDDRPSDYEFSANGLLFADRTPKPALREVRHQYGQFTD